MANATEDLIAAKDRLVKDGWNQNDYFDIDRDGKVCGRCAMGAVFGYGPDFEVVFPSPDYTESLRALRQATREVDPISQSIVEWNDKPGRNIHQVLAVFDRAIEISRG